jgi:hypothetical protein
MHFWGRFRTVLLTVGILLIVGLAAGIRSINLDKLDTIQNDEETWVLSGISLIQKGYPESWTVFWETYGEYHWSYIGGKQRVVVHPYLDHPPLFQLLMGGWAHVTENASRAPFDWTVLRIPMILVGMLTIVGTSLWVYHAYSTQWAIFTAASYIVLPTHILATRIIAAEHILALLLVVVVVALVKFLENGVQKRYAVGLLMFVCLVVFIAPLIKLSGIVIPLVAGSILIAHKKYRATLAVIGSALVGVGLYSAYGCYYDCTLFWSILQQHGSRPQTFWYFFTLFSKPDIGYFELEDPFFIVGLVGSLFAAISASTEIPEGKKIFLRSVWLACMAIFLVLAPIELYGWYKYVLFPLAAIGLGYSWLQIFRGQYLWSILIIPAILVSFENIFIFESQLSFLRKAIIFLAITPLFLWLIKSELVKYAMYRYWAVGLFVISLTLQVLWAVEVLLAL